MGIGRWDKAEGIRKNVNTKYWQFHYHFNMYSYLLQVQNEIIFEYRIMMSLIMCKIIICSVINVKNGLTYIDDSIIQR
jgi:hypothetical protein